MRVIVTHHLRSRFRERFSFLIDGNLSSEQNIKNLIAESIENKQFINDTMFCQFLYETYGYHIRYRFFVYKDKVVFVMKEERQRLIGVTCFDTARKNMYKSPKKFRKKAQPIPTEVELYDMHSSN